MSAKAIAWAFERRGLAPTTRNVLFVLADSADKYGKCWPSIPTIAYCAEVSENTARKAVLEIADGGLMSISARVSESGRVTSNMYQLHPDARVLLGEEKLDVPLQPAEGATPANPEGVTPAKFGGSPLQPAEGSYTLNLQKEEEQNTGSLLPESPTPKPRETKQRGTSNTPPVALPAPPDWIDAEAWDGFVEMRRRKKAPLTAYAAKLAFGKLQRFRDAGEDANEILRRSVMGSWTDFYSLLGDRGKQVSSDDGWKARAL